HIHQIIFRICPCCCARKAGMSEGTLWCQHTCATTLIYFYCWLVPAPCPPALIGLPFDKFLYRLFFQQVYSTIIPLLKHHLHDNGHIIGCSKQPCMTRNPSHHGCSGIMHITLDQSLAEGNVVF